MILRPNFIRSSRGIVVIVLAGAVATYLYQGYFESHWWSFDYILSLTIPLVLMPLIIWFGLVPRILEVFDDSISIGYWYRRPVTIPLEQIKHWGFGQNVLLLEFQGHQTFQIYLAAYPNNQWSSFVDILASRYPRRKAKGWFGTRGI